MTGSARLHSYECTVLDFARALAPVSEARHRFSSLLVAVGRHRHRRPHAAFEPLLWRNVVAGAIVWCSCAAHKSCAFEIYRPTLLFHMFVPFYSRLEPLAHVRAFISFISWSPFIIHMARSRCLWPSVLSCSMIHLNALYMLWFYVSFAPLIACRCQCHFTSFRLPSDCRFEWRFMARVRSLIIINRVHSLTAGWSDRTLRRRAAPRRASLRLSSARQSSVHCVVCAIANAADPANADQIASRVHSLER